MKQMIFGRNPWYLLSVTAFLAGLYVLLQDAGLQRTPLAHDLASLGALHLYTFTLIFISGLILHPRGLADARDLAAISATARYAPFLVQLILFARRDAMAYPIAITNFICFMLQSELLGRLLQAPRNFASRMAHMGGLAGPVLMLPGLIRPLGDYADPRLIEAAWFVVAAGIVLQIYCRRDDLFDGELDPYIDLLHAGCMIGLLLAPMAVGLLTARAVVLLPMFLSVVTLFCQEILRRSSLGGIHRIVKWTPGLVAGVVSYYSFWPPYELIPWLPLPVFLILWSILIELASGGNKGLLIAPSTGGGIRIGCEAVRGGYLSAGWILIVTAFALLIPGVRRSMR